MRANSDHTRAFLRAAMPPGACLEIMAFRAQYERTGHVGPSGFATTLAGWYDRHDMFVVDSQKLRNVSGYLIPNPVDPAFLATSDNKLRKVGKGEACTDDNVTCLRWLYLDFDPKKPGREMSSTAAELAATISSRDRVFLDFPEFRDHAMWGCSGNGSWILVRLPDYPNDEPHRKLVARVVDHFAASHGADPATKNPARLMPLIGTLKCKGSDRQERPWRLATLDSPPTESRGFNLIGWVARHLGEYETPTPAPQVMPTTRTDLSRFGDRFHGDRVRRAEAYVARMDPAISGQGGHDQTFDAACVLVKGFDLDPAEALPILETFNTRCDPPWTRGELEHKVVSAHEKPDDMPRGYLYESPWARSPAGGLVATTATAIAPPASPPSVPATPAEGDDDPCMPGYEDNPHRLARAFLLQRFNHPDCRTLQFWAGQWWAWVHNAYRPVAGSEIKGQLSLFIHDEFERIYHSQLLQHGISAADDAKPPRPMPVTTNIVGHVVQALAGLVMLPLTTVPEQPRWIDGEAGWPLDECTPMRNGIVHLPSLADGLPCVRNPTPRLFSPYALGYEFDPKAPAPVRWLKFLSELWPDDRESIDALQEWMGLQLVPDTRYHKIMAFIGPPRSGKGTIARILQLLVGPENCAGPTLSGLGQQFGLASLQGKLSAIIDDARLSSKSDHAVIAERLLSISGEGTIDVDRKFRETWIGKMSCRVTLISNELPRLADTSGALPNRFVVLRFVRSFLGSEDKSLTDHLARELPGIFLWAAEGWRRLRDRGHFVQPQSGAEEFESMKSIASPVGSFVAECCTTDPDDTCLCTDAYRSWKAYCLDNSRREPGNQAIFGRDLRSVLPALRTEQRRQGDERVRIFRGLGLRCELSFGEPPNQLSGGFTPDWVNQ